MKFSIISFILSVAGIATAATTMNAAYSSQTCTDGSCYQNGQTMGASSTAAAAHSTTTAGETGAVVTQISDGQIQAPSGAPEVPVVAGAGKVIPGMAAAGVALAFLL